VSVPAVSIGLPVYNGAATIGRAVEALLAQTLTDFELVISDNASTDATGQICRGLMRRDTRIQYVRHPLNLGSMANFAYVLAQARAPFFMWATADDHWEPEFVAANLELLRADPRLVGSVSRVSTPGLADPGTRPLRGAFVRKVRRLLRENAGNSRFYGLFRTDLLRAAVREGARPFIASDWAVIIAAARRGDFAEADRVLMTRSTRGASSTWSRQMESLGVRGPSRVIPFYEFTKWLWRHLAWWEFLASLDLILLRNLSVTAHYGLEIARAARAGRPSPKRSPAARDELRHAARYATPSGSEPS
jgi:glycosyltransferase involved in cell wall biosynthesis